MRVWYDAPLSWAARRAWRQLFAMQACTIVARNYLPQARALARSFRTHHPEGAFTVLLLDRTGTPPEANDDFNILQLHDLGFDSGEITRMALIYDVLEFSTAVKPWLLQRLMGSGADVVLYFDPDIEIFAALTDLAALAREHGIVLTPHILEPIPRDGLRPAERDIMHAGIYNLGFIAVGRGSEPFLKWWAERLRRDAIVDPANMLFTDQRWVDFVPALFPHHILRDPGCNVAYWNLGQRRLRGSEAGYEVNGRPLRFFHYSGYDPDRPEVLSKFQGSAPRVRLQDEPALARLFAEYSGKLRAQGYAQSKDEPYGHGSIGEGVPIPPAIRRLYREALLKHEASGAKEPLSASATTSLMVEWLHGPLAALEPLDYTVGTMIDFGARGNSEPYRLGGWGATEQRFTWSVGHAAQIALRVSPQSNPLELEVFAGAFVHAPARPVQHVEIYAQSQKIADWRIEGPAWFRAKIPAAATRSGDYLLLEFRTPDAISPSQLLGNDPDERVLGMSVHHLRLVRLPWWRRLRSLRAK